MNFDFDEVLEDEVLPLGDTTIPETDEEGWPNVDGVQSMETDGNNPVEENLPSPVSGKRMNVLQARLEFQMEKNRKDRAAYEKETASLRAEVATLKDHVSHILHNGNEQ